MLTEAAEDSAHFNLFLGHEAGITQSLSLYSDFHFQCICKKKFQTM
jgi:ABC-type transport system involved in cytochrome c biogenesis ATPase subunit